MLLPASLLGTEKGIEMARGKYIWIAESDDKCDLNFLEEVTKPLINDGVYCLIRELRL